MIIILNNKKTIIFFIILVLMILISYFLDKDLGKILGIAGLFVWFLREFSKQLLAKDLEEFKYSLERSSTEFRIKFEKLHAERAEVIKNLYQKIIDKEDSFRSLINPIQLSGEPSQEEKIRVVVEKANEMIKYFRRNKIFFEEDLCNEVNILIKKYNESWQSYNLSMDLKNEGNRHIKEWGQAWDNIKEVIPPIQKKIENKFRKIIGID